LVNTTIPNPNAAVGKLFVAAEGAAGGGTTTLCLRTTFLVATIFNSIIFLVKINPHWYLSEGVILNLVGYCGVFLALGLAGALIAAGFGLATAFGSAGFFTNVRFFFSGRAGSATIFPTVAGLLGWSAQASGESLCSPTQNPVELRPQPHLGGSLAGVETAAGVSILYGAPPGAITSDAVFLPVKNSIIFLNINVSYNVFITEQFLAKKSDRKPTKNVALQQFVIYNSTWDAARCGSYSLLAYLRRNICLQQTP
jgi:hypothetical protein